MRKHVLRLLAGLLAFGLICGVLWIVYVPAHWLTPFGATVTVDEHPAQADIYIGNPTQNEAKAIAFVQVRGVGDYFLDFENEKYREASSREFIPLQTWRVDVCTHEPRAVCRASAIPQNQ